MLGAAGDQSTPNDCTKIVKFSRTNVPYLKYASRPKFSINEANKQARRVNRFSVRYIHRAKNQSPSVEIQRSTTNGGFQAA